MGMLLRRYHAKPEPEPEIVFDISELTYDELIELGVDPAQYGITED